MWCCPCVHKQVQRFFLCYIYLYVHTFCDFILLFCSCKVKLVNIDADKVSWEMTPRKGNVTEVLRPGKRELRFWQRQQVDQRGRGLVKWRGGALQMKNDLSRVAAGGRGFARVPSAETRVKENSEFKLPVCTFRAPAYTFRASDEMARGKVKARISWFLFYFIFIFNQRSDFRSRCSAQAEVRGWITELADERR